jgi:micrococcal nuclease
MSSRRVPVRSGGGRCRTRACALVFALVAIGTASAACATHRVVLSRQAPATLQSEPPGHETGEVTRVVDGDTIEVRLTGRVDGPGVGEARIGGSYSVRLIGIDTPESAKPNSPIECFGRESSAAAKALLEGSSVKLVKDVEETDRYDRLLRYVYVGHELANARLVINGYAAAYTYPPNVRHADLFVELQRQARESERGLWSPDTCSGEP